MKMMRNVAAAFFLAAGLTGAGLVSGADEAEAPELNPFSGNEKAIREGRSWYRNVCANCHGGRADGQGERGTGADLRKFDKGFREYVSIVKNGRTVAQRIQNMPAWGGVLKDDDIYKIGAYLETLATEGANWKQKN